MYIQKNRLFEHRLRTSDLTSYILKRPPIEVELLLTTLIDGTVDMDS